MVPLGLTDEACKGSHPVLLCMCSFLPTLLQICSAESPPSRSTFDAKYLTSLMHMISTTTWVFLNLTNVQHLARGEKKKRKKKQNILKLPYVYPRTPRVLQTPV